MPTHSLPLRAQEEIKIVWRMTGDGDFHLVAIGPQGQQISPIWGPDLHAGSTWLRPGEGWGAGFNLPVEGCWDFRATRDGASGDVWLIVASKA